jgi:hypothetical protein
MKSIFLTPFIPTATDEGFSFIEVLAGILIATVFVLIATQGVLISTIFRINAQRASAAKTWIEEEVGNDQYIATTLAANPAFCGATSGDNGYADALRDVLDGATSDPTLTVLATNPDPISATGETVQMVIGSRDIVNKDYKIRKAFTPDLIAPFDVLAVEYEVWFDKNNDNAIDDATDRDEAVIADFYTEMIPAAALQCALND